MERESFWPFASLDMKITNYQNNYPALLAQFENQDTSGSTRLHTILHQFFKTDWPSGHSCLVTSLRGWYEGGIPHHKLSYCKRNEYWFTCCEAYLNKIRAWGKTVRDGGKEDTLNQLFLWNHTKNSKTGGLEMAFLISLMLVPQEPELLPLKVSLANARDTLLAKDNRYFRDIGPKVLVFPIFESIIDMHRSINRHQPLFTTLRGRYFEISAKLVRATAEHKEGKSRELLKKQRAARRKQEKAEQRARTAAEQKGEEGAQALQGDEDGCVQDEADVGGDAVSDASSTPEQSWGSRVSEWNERLSRRNWCAHASDRGLLIVSSGLLLVARLLLG